MNRRYKVGDKVMINISCHTDGEYFSVNDDMIDLNGKITKITKMINRNGRFTYTGDIHSFYEYRLEIDGGYWSWDEGMIVPAEEYKVMENE